MIQKRIQPAAWFQERPTATLLNVYSKGFEKAQLQKLAADEYIFTVDVKPEKGFSFVHLISVAAGERYGPNNNADFFNKTAREYACPAGTRQLAGGLHSFHGTFMKSGGVYRNHQNSKKGFKPEGEIIAEAVNPVMDRGELIIKLADEKWHDSLEKLSSEEPIFFSMGCGVPYDICTVCLNEASSRSSYCEHLRYNKLGLTKEGIQICAINDRPHFHDISYLAAGDPADRIAFGLRKVAQTGAVLDEEDLSGIWIPLELMNKIASRRERDRADLLNKLAVIEKRISIEGMSSAEEDVAEACPSKDDSDDLVDSLKGIPLDKLFYGLNKKKMLLPPGAFISIVLHKPKNEIAGINELPAAIKDIFGKLKEEGDFDELLHDGSYLPGMNYPGNATMDNIEDLADRLSLDEEPVRHRIMLIAIRGGKTPKIKKEAGQRKPGAEAQYLAKEYAKYQLSFLAGTNSNELLQLVALNNQVGE